MPEAANEGDGNPVELAILQKIYEKALSDRKQGEWAPSGEELLKWFLAMIKAEVCFLNTSQSFHAIPVPLYLDEWRYFLRVSKAKILILVSCRKCFAYSTGSGAVW
jgi:hypothetical protein